MKKSKSKVILFVLHNSVVFQTQATRTSEHLKRPANLWIRSTTLGNVHLISDLKREEEEEKKEEGGKKEKLEGNILEMSQNRSVI